MLVLGRRTTTICGALARVWKSSIPYDWETNMFSSHAGYGYIQLIQERSTLILRRMENFEVCYWSLTPSPDSISKGILLRSNRSYNEAEKLATSLGCGHVHNANSYFCDIKNATAHIGLLPVPDYEPLLFTGEMAFSMSDTPRTWMFSKSFTLIHLEYSLYCA